MGAVRSRCKNSFKSFRWEGADVREVRIKSERPPKEICRATTPFDKRVLPEGY